MKRFVAVTASVVVALAFAAVAIAVAAEDQPPPRVDAVLARFSFASAYEKQRLCQGEDGLYIEIRAHHEGTQTGDPRLSGDLELEAHNLVNLETGRGTSEGTFVIRDPATNEVKARGRYYGVFMEGSAFRGLAVANVKDGLAESQEIALFSAQVNLATGEVVGQLGGLAPDTRTPAVVYRGACSGPWTLVGGR